MLTKLWQEAEEDFGSGKFAGRQKQLWDLLEHSDSSTAAQVSLTLLCCPAALNMRCQVVSVLSTTFVAVSIVGMTVNTLESLQYSVSVCTLNKLDIYRRTWTATWWRTPSSP